MCCCNKWILYPSLFYYSSISTSRLAMAIRISRDSNSVSIAQVGIESLRFDEDEDNERYNFQFSAQTQKSRPLDSYSVES